MKRLVLSCALALASSVQASEIYFDFGDSSQITPGNYNNIIVNPPATLSIPNAVDSTGAGTGVSVAVSGFFNGSNTQGATVPTGAAAIFNAQATRDNGFGHAGVFGTNPLTPMGTVAIAGLNPSQSYNFDFFAARAGATDNRETEYAVTGNSSVSAFLNPSSNTSNIASVLGMTPNALGEITVQIDPGPNNNNSSLFWYIGAMRISDVPEPASASAVLLLQGLLRRRRSIGN